MIEISRTIYDKTKAPFIRACLYLGISANALTLLNHFITLTFGVYFFMQGTWAGWLSGLFVCCINGYLDYLDGDVARQTNQLGKLGNWLDSGFDVIIQNAVMGAIGLGCVKSGLPIWMVAVCLVSIAANNFVSFNYNTIFGFDSDKGNKFFRNKMDEKKSPVNEFFKNLIDPTASKIGLTTFTYRYWIAGGAVLNAMPLNYIIMTTISTVKWIAMYTILALYFRGDRNMHVLKTLSMLDEESAEFYKHG